ncbi:hypothetical protein [Pectobacterium parvum]|uniref:hypothetical protein n=1 Tax=Pectobacterium parvum TaxID=2778550 RepID=UPI002159AA90|nr:hypothetical protein [Pectobacterium parvum]UVD98964.1 hypothetical protein NV347_08235 [Pectobacterium parvum]
MDTSHSENWAFLFKLLHSDSGKALHGNGNFSVHQQAYALALFLADATLATPELNRCNVAELIAGKLPWPCSENTTVFPGTQYSLAFFEAGGFISFPGGWADVHCREPQQAKLLDQSIEDILRVTNLLKNISFGWRGYVQPHFVIEETKLAALFSKELGIIQVDRLLPCAVQQGGKVAIYPERPQFTQLESTYLWQCLLKRHSPEQAFRQWMLCVRTLSHSVIPVQFSLLEENETAQFLHQVELLVKTAPEFSYPLRTIYKQSINSYDFAHLIQPVTLKINLHLGSDNNMPDKTDEQDEPTPLTPMTAENLNDAYNNIPDIDDPADIIALGQWQHWGNWRDPMGALSWLIQSCFNHVITIDHNSLSTKHFALNLLSLAESRQALKYLLFIGFPLRFNCKYLLFLLSKPQTCEIAIYHLTNGEFLLPLTRRHDMSGDLSQLYLEALLEEYIRTIEDRPGNGLKLLNVSLYFADNSGLYTSLHTGSFQYRALTCFMHKLEDKHVAAVASAFLETIPVQYERRVSHIRERSVYHLGLWLIQRLESTDVAYRDLLPQLGECLIRFYSSAFSECISTRRRDLKSDNFFALLPWKSLIKVIGINEILRLSSRYDSWTTVLTYKHDRCFDAVSAICQYLQLLMLISKGPQEEDDRLRLWQRIINIVCALGFGHEEERCYLFSAVLNDEAADLWKVFSLFVNILPPSKYDEFTERCIDMIPLDSLYILLERCNIHERKQVLHDAILDRQELSDEKLGLKSLETAFIHACENGHMELAERILSAAKPLLERFRGHSHIQFKETIYRWETYHYKYTLLSTYLSGQEDPHNFEEVVLHIPLPDGLTGLPGNEIVNRQLRECEQFRRYIIATAFCQIEPSKTVRYMEALCAEVNAPHFAYTLFKGHIAELSDNQNKAARRHALNKFLEQTSSITPDQMAVSWVAMVLEVMIQVGDQQRTDEYWRKLTGEQHRTREILLPYCKGLIQRGQALVASQIINEFREFNLILSERDVGLTELITQLSQTLPSQNSVLDIVHAMAESSQRSIDQLRQHYFRITGGSFEDYVQITGSGCSKEMFLKKVITEVAGELLLRKKNLQTQQSTDGQLNRIINEDLINDWFASLVDMRMAEARIGFRDQKRTGSSESGKSPGESDGLITDSKNRRIAIFEAFRLSSLNKKVITEHLNKVSGYDAEALSPVFMVAYCDAKDFSTLTTGYHSLISRTDYTGYKKNGQLVKIDKETITDNLWTCTETRLRGEREVIFCHFLLNMHCN